MSLPRPAPDTGLFTPLEFAPTRRRQSVLLAVLLGLCGLGLAWSLDESLAEAGAALPWRLAAAAVLLLALTWLLRTMLRHALSRQPVLRLDARGIWGAGLAAPVPWEALDDALLSRGGMLRLVLRPDAVPAAPRRWFGADPARPRLSLHLLAPAQQDIAYDALHARLDVLRQRAGAGEAASRRAARAELAFEQHLDRLVPSPWALYAVVGANVLLWAMTVAAGLSPLRPLSPQLFDWGANAASAVVLDGQWWRLLSATFLHAGIVHLVFNMLGLWEAGKQLCRLLGNGQFLLVYLGSALLASTASLHHAGQGSVSVGASGAVFGVLGALLTTSWHYRHLVPPSNLRRLWAGLGFFLAYSLLHGFTRDNVDNAAHLGGLVAGLLLGLLLLGPLDRRVPAGRRHGRAALAGVLAAAGVVYGVLATPLPPIWHAQHYAAQRALPEIGRHFEHARRQLGALAQRLQQQQITRPDFVAAAERAVAPVCARVAEQLGPLQVPQWDPIGRLAQLYPQVCAATLQALRLEAALLRGDPQLPPDARAQLGAAQRELDLRMRQLAEALRPTAARAQEDHGPRPPR